MAFSRGRKSLRLLASQWDSIASKREEQIRSGKDHSANEVLAPAVISRIPNKKLVLDVGCGTGWLTVRAAAKSKHVTGIDPSRISIEVAQRFNSAPNCDYFASSVENFSRDGLRFQAAFANMSVSSAPNIDTFFSTTYQLLRKKAHFIITLPHPCFWPLYWGYVNAPWFEYGKEISIESEFRIQQQRTKFRTTHFHRPLTKYISSLQKAGFKIAGLEELYGQGFELPRFLLIEAVAT